MVSKMIKIGLGLALCSTLAFATTADEEKAFINKEAQLCDNSGEETWLKEAFNVKEG